MRDRAYLPNSRSGENINGVFLEKTLVERIYSHSSIPNSPKTPIDTNFVEWIFLVGIYKSQDKYYLLLEANDFSSTVNWMIDDGIFPNTGFIQIPENTAIELATKISKLGKEYFEITIPNFYKLISLMVSSIECPVVFSALLNEGGYFDRIKKVIVVANNQSQFCMIWSLVHEYVHFLINDDKNFSRTMPPRTREEYLLDREEYLCETIAFEVVSRFLGMDFITSIVKNAALKMKKSSKFGNRKRCDFSSLFSPEEVSIINYLFRNNTEINREEQKTINSFVERILNDLKAKIDKNLETYIDCAQTGLVILSLVDNQSLYDMIINEISPMIPEEDC